MLGWLARVALLRVLPRRLVPILTAIEVFRFLRSARRRNAAPLAARGRTTGPIGPLGPMGQPPSDTRATDAPMGAGR